MRAKVEAANDALTRFLMPGGSDQIDRLTFAKQMLEEALETHKIDLQIRHEQMQIMNGYAAESLKRAHNYGGSE